MFMLEVILVLYSVYTALRMYISVMQISYINVEKQKSPVLMPASKYKIAAEYAVAKEKLSVAEAFVDYVLFVWWVLMGFSWMASWIQFQDGVLQSVFFLFGFVFINYLVGLPFELYQKFKIDEAFGFNQMTFKIYLADTLKSALMFFVFGGGFFALLVWIIASSTVWWLWGFVLVFAVAILVNVLYPIVIAPLFNKFNPLEEGELKDAITALMEQAGLKSNGIFVMDASKRDSRLNAYFGGLGKSKRVVLFDTLVQKLNIKELLAVLGHELGHFSHGDIWKNIGLMGVLLFVSFYLFGHLPDTLFAQMGVAVFPGVEIAVMMLLLSLVSFMFTPFMSYVSRHNEYAADAFGSQMGGRENLVSALLKLITENKSFPKSHPLVIFFYYTHPPVLERLKELGYDATDVMADKKACDTKDVTVERTGNFLDEESERS